MTDYSKFDFAYPWMFLCLIFIAPILFRHFKGYGRATVRFSATEGFRNLCGSPLYFKRNLLFWIQILTLILLVIAAARPRFGNSVSERKSEGLDIVLAIDTSGSMRAMDLKLNQSAYDRLTVVKNVILDFVNRRKDDRIGMVVFGTEAFTQAPLTLDHQVLIRFLGDIRIEMAGKATAIGNAIAVASKRLEKLESKSKIIILLTDGENTAGEVDPKEAADAAATLGIKIYTIGVGSKGMAPMPYNGMFGTATRNVRVNIDEKLLKEIAQKTGGQSFLARNTEDLKRIYATIDTLEKTEVEIEEYMNYKEASSLFLWPALAFMLLQALLSITKLRNLP